MKILDIDSIYLLQISYSAVGFSRNLNLIQQINF